MSAAAPIVQLRGVGRTFGAGHRAVRAVDDVSFDIAAGETLGLVGESGSGKSTLGRIVVGLLSASAGRVTVAGKQVGELRGAGLKALWREVQMVFQDPYSSLNPKLTVREALAEPLRNFGIARGPEAETRIRAALSACGLPASAVERYPSEFSGGQRQRIGIARALILRPAFIVADEPVSALDVSIQAQIINLLRDLKAEFGLTYLFIAHDLAVVRHVSDRVAVMYRGRVVEIGTAEQVYGAPLHPYTHLLLRSVPMPEPAREAERLAAGGAAEVVNAVSGEGGCGFAARCPLARFPICAAERPPLTTHSPGGHLVACHFADDGRAVPPQVAGAGA